MGIAHRVNKRVIRKPRHFSVKNHEKTAVTVVFATHVFLNSVDDAEIAHSYFDVAT